MAVELDALPDDVLKDQIRVEIEKRMSMDALAQVRLQEDQVRYKLRSLLKEVSV